MNKLKMIIAVLCGALMISTIPYSITTSNNDNGICANAATTFTDGMFNFYVSTDDVGNEYAVLSDYIGDNTEMVIPSSVSDYDGNVYTTRTIGNNFLHNNTTTDIIMPDTITSISFDAFKNKLSLQHVTWSQRLTFIGKGAFTGCNNLESLDLPDSVETIGENAFKFCFKIREMHLPASLKDISSASFEGCPIENITGSTTNDTKYYTDGYSIINSETRTLECFLAKYTPKSEYRLPEDIDFIKDSAMIGIRELNTLIIPKNLGTSVITGDLLNRMISLNNIVVEDGCENYYTDGKALYSFDADVSTPGDSKYVSTIVYYFDKSFNEVYDIKTFVPEGVSVLPNDVKINIGAFSFNGNTRVAEVNCFSKVNSVGAYAFRNCTDMKIDHNIYQSASTIYNNAFENCHNIYGDLLLKAKNIYASAFAGCDEINTIDLLNYGDSCSFDISAIPYSLNLNSIIFNNPDIEITEYLPSSSITYTDKLLIKGHRDSTAQTFAETHSINFEVLPDLNKCGDTNCDGKVTISDAVFIMQSLCNPDEYKLSEQGKINGNTVGSDGITGMDALAIQFVECKTISPEDLPITAIRLNELCEG